MPEEFDNYMWKGPAGQVDSWMPSNGLERRPAKWYGDGIYEQDGRWYVMGYNPNGGYADRSMGKEIDDARGGFGSMSDAELAASEMWHGMNPDFRYDPESQSWNASEIVNYGDGYPYGLPNRGDRYRYNFSTPDDVWFENDGEYDLWEEKRRQNAGKPVEPDDEWRRSVKKGDVYYDPIDRGYRIRGTTEFVKSNTLDPKLAEDLAMRSGHMFMDDADVNPDIVQFSDLAKELQESGIEYEPVRDKYDKKKYYKNGGNIMRYTVYFRNGGLLPRSQRRVYQTGGDVDQYSGRVGPSFLDRVVPGRYAKRDLYASESLEDLNPDVNMDLDPDRREEYDREADRIYNQRYRNYYKDKFKRYFDNVKGFFGGLKGGAGAGRLDHSTLLDRYMVPHIGQEEIDQLTKA